MYWIFIWNEIDTNFSLPSAISIWPIFGISKSFGTDDDACLSNAWRFGFQETYVSQKTGAACLKYIFLFMFATLEVWSTVCKSGAYSDNLRQPEIVYQFLEPYELWIMKNAHNVQIEENHKISIHFAFTTFLLWRKTTPLSLFWNSHFRVDIYCTSKGDHMRMHMLNHIRSPTKAIQKPIRVRMCIGGECVRSSQSARHWKRYVYAISDVDTFRIHIVAAIACAIYCASRNKPAWHNKKDKSRTKIC